MRIVLMGLIMVVAGAIAAQAQPTTPKAVLQAAVVDYIRPSMLRFDAASRGLDSAMEALCTAPSSDGHAIAAQEFAQVVATYAKIDFLRVGPLMADNRADRLLFWPDRRSIGLKQVQAILAEQDPDAIVLESLQAKSVAVQGLGALEFVLFGTGWESLASDEGAYRCAYGRTIALNISGIAQELASAWYVPDGIADHLQFPQPDYADYRTDTETMEALVGLVSHGLEGLRDQFLQPFMAGDDRAAKPKLAVFWRSGLTMTFVRSRMDGMAALIAASGISAATDADHQGLGNTIAFEFSNADRAIDIVTLPVAEAVADEKQAKALDYLLLVTNSLHEIVGEQLSAALGLSVGFSALDGD